MPPATVGETLALTAWVLALAFTFSATVMLAFAVGKPAAVACRLLDTTGLNVSDHVPFAAVVAEPTLAQAPATRRHTVTVLPDTPLAPAFRTPLAVVLDL